MSDDGWGLYLHGHATVDGPPVTGDASAFEDAGSWFVRLAEDAREVSRALDGLAQGTDGGFQGESADAFADLLVDAAERLRTVPLIAEAVAEPLQRHATELSGLQNQAATLLARAETAWKNAVTAEKGRDDSEVGLRAVREQLEVLEAAEDSAPGSVETLRAREARLASDLSHLRANASDAREELHRIATAHEDLRDREQRLDTRTASALREQQLWDLRDPRTLERISQAVVDGLTNLAEGIGQFFAEGFESWLALGMAILERDWRTAVAAYNDLVSRLSTVLLVVGLVLVLVLSKGTAAPLLLKLKAGLPAAKLATSQVKLATSATMNVADIERLDGTEVTMGDVAWDAAGLASSQIGAAEADAPPVNKTSNWTEKFVKLEYDGTDKKVHAAVALGNVVDVTSRGRSKLGLVQDGWQTWHGDTGGAAPLELGPPCALPERVRSDAHHVNTGPKGLTDPAVPYLVSTGSTGLPREER